MSRVGKQPIVVPKDLKVTIENNIVSVKGSKGLLSVPVSNLIKVDLQSDAILVSRINETKQAKQLHGLSRTLIYNMVKGLSVGFKKELDIEGVGYRAELKGNALQMSLGFSHQVDYTLPKGVDAVIDAKKTKISLTSIDKQLLGTTAAKIRSFRPPEPYGGKGIRYSDEVIVRKEGKSAGK
jgi:large subunit ribosomal protein L6